MNFPKSVAALFTLFIASLVFMPGQAEACYCAQKPDGQYICETHCAPHEITGMLGANHGPIQYVTDYLTGNFLPPGVPIPGSTGTASTPAPTSGSSSGTTTNNTQAGGSKPKCYVTSSGDYICPQGGLGTATTPGTSIYPGNGSKPGMGTPLQPPSNTNNPTPVFPLPSPAGSPVTVGNSATAYQWPPGFGCSADNNLIGPPPVGQTTADWKMTFMEEFNSFDTNVWNDTIWYEQSNPTRNYTVEDGALKIWPQRDASGNFFNRTIDTDGKYYQTYGYFEMEAKLPIGKGVWPAFWLFNHIGDRRPEMDIMEAYPGGGPGGGWGDANLHPVAFAATVWRTLGDNAGHKTLQTEDLSQDFHTYAVKWEPNKQTYYFDGEPFWELDISMPDPMYIMLDLWFGSASGQPDNSTPQGKNNSYVVNYVRAWENCGSTGSSSGSAANGGSSATDGNTIGGNPPPGTAAPSAPAPSVCTPSQSSTAPSGSAAITESFDGQLTPFGKAVTDHNRVSLAKGMGVGGSDAIKVDYVGNSEGSDRVLVGYKIPPALEYTLTFDVNFCSGFDFAKGGKLHGLGPSNPVAGGNAVNPAGWSAKAMFRPSGRLQSYIYSQNMKGQYGDVVQNDSFSFTPGRYYKVTYQVGVNNPASASNGYMKILVDGVELIHHNNIQFRSTESQDSQINTLMFNTFHGGHTPDWAPRNADGSYKTDCAYYDNFAVYPGQQVNAAPICTPDAGASASPVDPAPAPSSPPVEAKNCNDAGEIPNSLRIVQDDMALPSDAIGPAIAGYDWSKKSFTVMGAKAHGTAVPSWYPLNSQYRNVWWTSLVPWGVLVSGPNNPAKNSRVSIKDMKVYYFSKSSKKWIHVSTTTAPEGDNFNFSDDSSFSAGSRKEPDGTFSTNPGSNIFHFYSGQSTIKHASFNASDSDGIFITAKARLVCNSKSAADDRNQAKFLMSVGADYYPANAGNLGAPYNPGVGGGRFKYVTPQWQSFNSYFLNFPIASNPPPIPVAAAPAPAPAPTPSNPAPAPAPSAPAGQAPATPASTGSAFYVSPSGNNSNPGTRAAPWKTIQHAANTLKAGQTAILMDGTFTEGSINFKNSGTSSQPITFKAENKWKAVLKSTSGCQPGFSINASYITVKDIDFAVPANICGTYTSADTHIRAWNSVNPTPSNPTTGYVGFVADGLKIGAGRSEGLKSNQDFTILQNIEANNSLEVFGSKDIIVRNNVVVGQDKYGVSIFVKGGIRNGQIYDNIVRNKVPNGQAIIIGGYSCDSCFYDTSTKIEAYNTVAYRNTVYNESGGPMVGLLFQGAKDSTFRDNKVYGGQLGMSPGGHNTGFQAPTSNPTFTGNTIDCKGSNLFWNKAYTGTLTTTGNTFTNCGGAPAQ